ncbi:MAG: ABC transporter ATP-binding protein/permease [Thermoguttaceae bacterium]
MRSKPTSPKASFKFMPKASSKTRRRLSHFIRLMSGYWFSDDKRVAWFLLATVVSIVFVFIGLNIIINRLGGAMMTALSEKKAGEFWLCLGRYLVILAFGAPLIAVKSWLKGRLVNRWRMRLSERMLDKYLSNFNFYRAEKAGRIDNPDERIHQDTMTFADYTISFLLDLLRSVLAFFSFALILWSISRTLCGFLMLYALLGTAAVVLIGKKLIGIRADLTKKDADFRYSILHVRENAEPIALCQGEEREKAHIFKRLLGLFDAHNLMLRWNRNLELFTTGYQYYASVVPLLVLASWYFAGSIRFGDITQAEMAFSQVLNSLSIIVTSFSGLTGYIVAIDRLGAFEDSLDSVAPDAINRSQGRAEDSVALDDVTVNTPDRKVLLRAINFDLKHGESLLIMGRSGIGKTSLVRTIFGLWSPANGTVSRPALGRMLFMPQRPYLGPGSLREQLAGQEPVPDEELRRALELVRLEDLAATAGLDEEVDWMRRLSPGEMQRVGFARMVLCHPDCVVLDEATSFLDKESERKMYELLKDSGVLYITVSHNPALIASHNYLLELADGTGKLSVVNGMGSLDVLGRGGRVARMAEARMTGPETSLATCHPQQ